MNSSDKVMWGEGLFLRPQHFQQQDRYHEGQLRDMARTLHPYCWGVRKMTIDREALAHNKLRLLELSMVFPDGETYNAPDRDPLPPDIDLSELSLTNEDIKFYAALPDMKGFGSNFSQQRQSDEPVRYHQVNVETADAFTQASKAEIAYLKKSVRLLAESENRSAVAHLPILELRRASTGGFEVEPAFVAPSLSIQASPLLFAQLRRLMDMLQAKVNALHGHHREPSKNVIEFRSGDISSFWLLHTASSACASLSHYLHQPLLHPERLFEQLLGIAGSLLTFSKTYSLNDLPAYQHQAPGPCFAKLHAILRELLETVISTRYFAIALTGVKPSYYQGVLDSGKINSQTAFFLAVAADMPAIELVDAAPLRFKIGAPEDVDKLVLSAMPGVKLIHAPQTPSALPVRPDTHYFALDAKSPLYERMLQSQVISIYVPSGIRELKLELYAVAP